MRAVAVAAHRRRLVAHAKQGRVDAALVKLEFLLVAAAADLCGVNRVLASTGDFPRSRMLVEAHLAVAAGTAHRAMDRLREVLALDMQRERLPRAQFLLEARLRMAGKARPVLL